MTTDKTIATNVQPLSTLPLAAYYAAKQELLDDVAVARNIVEDLKLAELIALEHRIALLVPAGRSVTTDCLGVLYAPAVRHAGEQATDLLSFFSEAGHVAVSPPSDADRVLQAESADAVRILLAPRPV